MTDKAHPSGSETVTGNLLGYILAELIEDLLKNQHGAGAAEDGERLAGKQRVGHSGHGGAKQGLDGALKQTDRKYRQWVCGTKLSIWSVRRVLLRCVPLWPPPATLRR